MKKLLLSLFAVLTATFAFAGDGTKTNPYTVAELQAMDANTLTDAEAWVKAYIAGSANNKLENFVTTADGAVASNLMLADAQSETDYSKCVPMQLSSGSSARKALNLVDNPDNLGKLLLVKGTISKYFSVVGIKNASEWELSGEGVTPPDPQPQGDDFEAALTDAQGNWTFVDVTLPEGLSYIWTQTSSYGMKASAFANQTKYASESYLVSPAIILKENSVLTFDHVQRYAAEDPATQLTLWIRGDVMDSWQYQLPIPNYSDGTNWNFISSGEIDLSAYAGKTIRLGFRYTSNEDFAATWEIKNVKVTNAKAAEDVPTLKDPSNTADKPYSIAQAIDIINNKDQYDMSKAVYTKGIISAIKSIDVSKYERAQYWIVDQMGGDSIQVYNGYYLGEKVPFTADDQIKVGDEVVVYGKLTLYNTTYEIDQNNYIYSLNGKTSDGQEDGPYATVEAISIADFLQKADTETQYKLTGVVRNIANATYGNFDLCDKDNEDTKIYIYGVVKQDDLNNNKIWSSLDINEGDILTIVGTYTTYKDNPQIAKAIYIKHEKGSDPVVSIANTAETAYTATEANDITNAGKDLSTPVYVKGKISSINEISLSHGNATFDITDDNSTLLIYRTKYLDNENFSSEDQVKVGDEVIVLGTLKIYGGKPELTNGQICKLNDTVANGISQIVNGKLSKGQIYDLSGRRVEKAVKGIYIVNGKKVVF